MIRVDLSDINKERPIFDNFYIDFNALVYQCIRVMIVVYSKVAAF